MSCLRQLRGQQRGVSMMEMGIAAPLLALVLTAIAGFGQGTVENAAVARAVNDAVNILALGNIKDQNPAAVSATAITTFLQDTGTDPSKVSLHLLIATIPQGQTAVTQVYEGYGGTFPQQSTQYSVSGGLLKTPGALTLMPGDTVYVVEAWYEHPGVLGPFSQLGVAYGNRVVIR